MTNEEITMEVLEMLCEDNQTIEEILKTGIVKNLEIESEDNPVLTIYYNDGKISSHWL